MDIICHYNGAEEMFRYPKYPFFETLNCEKFVNFIFSTLSWNGTDEFQQSTRRDFVLFYICNISESEKEDDITQLLFL